MICDKCVKSGAGQEAGIWQIQDTLGSCESKFYPLPLTAERVRFVTHWAGSVVADTVTFGFRSGRGFSGSVLITGELQRVNNELNPYCLLRQGSGVTLSNVTTSTVPVSLSLMYFDNYYWRDLG